MKIIIEIIIKIFVIIDECDFITNDKIVKIFLKRR